MRKHSRAQRWVAALGAGAIALVGVGVAAMTASAAPTYEVTGEWVTPPGQVKAGEVVTGEWRFNVNDDQPAPANDPVDNVTVTFAAGGGIFTKLPSQCLTAGVSPASSISADGSSMTCNVGTVVEGTAVSLQTPIKVTGSGEAGETVTASATVGGQTAELPDIPIVSPFAQDMVWGQPSQASSWGSNYVDIDFEWTLNLATGVPAGPNSVSYTLNVAPQAGVTVAVAPKACSPFVSGNAVGHPYSGSPAYSPPNSIAPFVDSCTLTQSGPNTFTMTLTGIDYSLAQLPTKDSTNRDLPLQWNAVASGSVWFRLGSATANTSVSLTASAPTYTSVTGATSVDDASNNSSSKVITQPGFFSSEFYRGGTNDGGTNWDDTYEVSPNEVVVQSTHIDFGRDATALPNDPYGACNIIDTRYMTYAAGTSAYVQYESGGALSPSLYTMEYYVGSDPSVDPTSASYNPQNFDCGVGGADPGATGWTTTLPTDTTTIKAVRANIPFSSLNKAATTFLIVRTAVRDTAPTGQDIWQWGSFRTPSNGGWVPTATTTAAFGPLTQIPGGRYPYTTYNRDVMHVTGVVPVANKAVDRSVITPGVPATFTINYAAVARTGTDPVDGFVITDTMPAGMSYVAGSATPAPAISTNGSGQQVLTWTLNGVPVNATLALTYQANVADTVTPGSALTNSVTGMIPTGSGGSGNTTLPKTAQVTTATGGYTQIGKTADQTYLPNTDGSGDSAGSWTITLKSFDPITQAQTDVIDVLPYNGDERGTSYSGSYSIASVTPVAGATVYYSTADPASISDDPADASNGGFGTTTGNTVGWSTTPAPGATAIRVIAGELRSGGTQQVKIAFTTAGMAGGDVLVNRAQNRDTHTELVTRSSATTTMANDYQASLKKYVMDANGVWHDANDVTDYPTYHIGDEVPYRIVITNDGQGTLTNLTITDDLFPDGSFTVASLAPGQSETHEFTEVMTGDMPDTVVNTACATADTPADAPGPVIIDCDPAGLDLANYVTVKTSDPAAGSTVNPGDVVTYTVTVTQQGDAPANAVFTDDLSDVLDDASYNGDVTASIGTASYADGVISWNGTIPVGGTATVTYSMTVNDPAGDGNAELLNVVTSPGCVPVDGEFPDCTTDHPEGWFTLSKTSDPTPGSDVAVGEEVTYTLIVTQEGKAAVPGASFTDDLSAVLDDATWNNDATASAGTITKNGDQLSWTGDLAVGDVVTVTYSVTTTAAGDGELLNVAIPDGPGECVPAPDENPDCTTNHKTGAYTVSKTSDPTPGSTVEPGSKVTYIVEVVQTGQAAVKSASLSDDLSRVLDDASYNGDVSADSGTAKVDGSTLTWTGDLAVGQKVRITYSVTVKDNGGNGILTNVVTPGKDGKCVPAADQNPDCTTTHKVPGLTLLKQVETSPGSGVWVTQGEGVGTYKPGDNAKFRILVTNTGQTTLTNVVVNDPLAPGCNATVPSMEPGTQVTLYCTMTVTKNVTNVVTAKDDGGHNRSSAADVVTGKMPHTGFGGAAGMLAVIGGLLGLGGVLLVVRARRNHPA